jgi:hypothetical protein
MEQWQLLHKQRLVSAIASAQVGRFFVYQAAVRTGIV